MVLRTGQNMAVIGLPYWLTESTSLHCIAEKYGLTKRKWA